MSEQDLLRDIVQESFYEFTKEFWDTVIAETPVWNWHIRYLCDELQELAERVFEGKDREYDLIINISPGSTKSTICSIMFPAWVWTRMPSARVIGGSYAHNLSMDLSLKCRDIVRSDKYTTAFPNLNLREDQQAKSYFMNTKGGSRYAVGVGGSVTGMHGHFLIVDDPLDPTKAVSEAEIKTANRWMSETLPTRKVNKAVTPTILIMQRLHQNDCTSIMLERAEEARKADGLNKAKIRHICLPAEIIENSSTVIPADLKDFYIDGLMDPVRLSRSTLNESLAALGNYGYAGQFLQNPIPLGGGMFKVVRVNVEDVAQKGLSKRFGSGTRQERKEDKVHSL